MESKEVSAEQILECSLLPVILLKTYEMETTVMGFHVYKTSWNPYVGEELRAVMQPNNLMDKFAVAVERNELGVVGHLPLGKSGKFAKTIFYFLKANQQNSCNVIVRGKAVNEGDGKGMKVPCRLLFSDEERFINVLQKQLYQML